MTHDAVSVIRTKRDGGRLSDDQIDWFIDGYTSGVVADEQASALTMAIFLRGMEPEELARWTGAMIESGVRFDLSAVPMPTVDKHSTGGVGDKVSLILVPLAAACGVAVPQVAGRGLGHTGGTLDKMEAIPGWRASLSPDEFVAQLTDVGGVIAAANDDLAPADRKLYALRDVTSTVDSIPLIASSIMSKKIAEGTGGLVLDVKYGSGAFLPEPDRGRELARTMVGIGHANGVDTVAMLTPMESPLGQAAGNAIEVTESVDVLRGGGPADLVEVTLALTRQMVRLAGLDVDPAEKLADGSALAVWDRLVRAQGGDPDAALPEAAHRRIVAADRDGVVAEMRALPVGIAAWRLGAGRARKEDPVSAGAGVMCHAKPGDEVRVGDPVFELLTDDDDRFAGAEAALEGGWSIADAAPEPPPAVLDVITIDDL
ncbi:MAG: thymidine phosphorylase [Actinomycetota bacterium]